MEDLWMNKSTHNRKKRKKNHTIDTLRNEENGPTIGDVPVQFSSSTTKSVNGGRINNR
jgi:hypothetical protein